MTAIPTTPPTWQVAPEHNLSLARPVLMGILNITPDSFSDGGKYDSNLQQAISHAVNMVEQGATIIDVGGESTRPGAERIWSQQQIERTVPVIEQLSKLPFEFSISVDTTLSAVAKAALDAGATIINDVSAGQEDEAMFSLAAECGCGLILMHRKSLPSDDSFSDQYDSPPLYDDVVCEVREFLQERIDAALNAGVSKQQIVVDPGLGFGKTVEQNFELIHRVDELHSLGCPVLSAASRKSFIGSVTKVREPAERIIGSIAVSVAMYRSGCSLFRVHDVAEHRQALDTAAAIWA